MDPLVEEDLQRDGSCPFGALTIELADRTVRLLDGAAEIRIGGDLFTGEDELLGLWAGAEPLNDGQGAEAPGVTLMFKPASEEKAAAALQALPDGAAVTILFGVLDPISGRVVGEVETWGVFDLDVPSLQPADGTSLVAVECTSIWDRLDGADDGVSLTDASHQSFWPGELGLKYVTDVIDKPDAWGSKDGRQNAVTVTPTTVPAVLRQGLGSLFR